MMWKAGSERRGRIRAAAARSTIAVALVLAVNLSGCSQPAPVDQQANTSVVPPETVSVPRPDPAAKPGAIDETGKVEPGTIYLSMQALDRVQWQNNGSDTVVIILKDSHVIELVPPHQLSAAHAVCLTCGHGTYPYKVKRLVKGLVDPAWGTPTEPQLSVGD
ncbi:MAG TPA: hypothetical protein VJY35_01265 [Candidatus Eisenbacteria bacterium]|nr:hypothetical protein [Candidatus Eisenbacteria bacterium]